MQPLQLWKRANKCLELFQEHNRRDSSIPQTHQMSLIAASSWAFLGSLKQAVYAGSWEASNIDQLKKRDHLEVKGGHRRWAVMKRTSGSNDQGQTFNNRVLRLPAIVLLNTTFRPGNSAAGLLRVYVKYPVRGPSHIDDFQVSTGTMGNTHAVFVW